MSGFDEKMEQLRARFRRRAASDRHLLAGALEEMDKVGIRRIAHGLAGTAGVFGYQDISRHAGALEEAVDAQTERERLQALGAALLARLDAAQED